jgi:hypothetical protein
VVEGGDAPAASPQASLSPDGSFVGRDGELRALLGLASEAQLGDGRGDVSLATPLPRHSLDLVRSHLSQDLITTAIQLADALGPAPGQ